MPSTSTRADAALPSTPCSSQPSPHSPTLSIWVIGNPTSGGRRGAVVLGRLAKVFQKTYGADAVQQTQSSHFLSLAFPAQEGEPIPNGGAVAAGRTDVHAFAHLPSLDAIWDSGRAPSTAAAGPTPPITPPASPQAEAPPSSASPATAQVRMMFIHTDCGGHATAVSNALSRLILRSRLAEQHQQQQQQQQHLVLVVGGDGTLSEVVNGLCVGTLAAYQHFTAALHQRQPTSTSSSSSSSHAQVEQEAAVFTHLLPALLYIPGGTGADFAKLGLCCPTPEAALHVVRDGLAKALLRRAPLNGGSSPTGVDAACYGCSVDIGRIEFLSTGTRHFFINICSLGMSCDVIQRGERFKRSRFVSMLGGTLLFALSAFISLLLMTPKPLYLCKLPPRVARRPVSEPAEMEDTEGEHRETIAGSVSGSGVGCGSSGAHPLSSLAPFSPLRTQLQCLHAQLSPLTTYGSASLKEVTTTTSHIFSSPHGESVYAVGKDGSAYGCHVDTALPPPHAKTVQCTTSRTYAHDVRQCLDMEEREMRLLRCQNAQQLHGGGLRRESGAGAENCASRPAEEVDVNVATSGDAKATQHHATVIQYGDIYYQNRSSPTAAAAAAAGSNGIDVDGAPQHVTSSVNDDNDDLAALTWVELPSSMVAFANGRWYGGGMHVAPHANPTDAMLSCTNWVATVLPFVSGVFSLYTGRHLRWRTTSAFEGERFLVSTVAPSAEKTPVEPLFIEADGEVLESVPAIVEVAGKITFIVPKTSQLCVGDAAPGTTRASIDAADQARDDARRHDSAAPMRSAESTSAQTPGVGERLRRTASGFGSLWRRSWGYAMGWSRSGSGSGGGGGDGGKSDSGEEASPRGPVGGPAWTTRRHYNSNADDVV